MHRGQSTEFNYVLYTKEKCVTIRVTCTFTLNITSSEVAWSCIYSVLNSLSYLISKTVKKNGIYNFQSTLSLWWNKIRFFFSRTTPFPSIKKDPTYICAHIIWFVSTMQLLIWQHYSASVTHTPGRYPLSVGQQLIDVLTQGRGSPLLTVNCSFNELFWDVQIMTFDKLKCQCKKKNTWDLMHMHVHNRLFIDRIFSICFI